MYVQCLSVHSLILPLGLRERVGPIRINLVLALEKGGRLLWMASSYLSAIEN